MEVTKIDGQDSYQGSVQHGVTSLSKSSTEGAFMFQGIKKKSISKKTKNSFNFIFNFFNQDIEKC